MKHLLYRLLVGCLLCLISKSYAAQEPLELLTSPLPIFSEQQDDGRMSGYSVEYARGVFEIAGYESQVTTLPFARLIKQIGNSESVVATGIGRTPARENDFYWIAPMTANVIGVFSLGDETANGQKIERLEQVTSVGVLRGDYRAEILRTKAVRDVVEFNSWEQAVGAVLKGRVSSVFFSELGVALTCKSAGLDCSGLTKTYTYDVQFSYMAMPKTDHNRPYAIKLSSAVEQFVQSREFNQLVDRWLPQLQLVEPNVDFTEGVITLGKLEKNESIANQIWVLTHLEPPFSEYDERGNPTGYAVELVRGILTEAGMRQQVLAAPWQRIFVESKMKSDVLVFSLARTAEREEKFHWISPITQNSYSVFTRQSNQLSTDAKAIEDLPPGSSIAVLAGDFREQVIIDAGHKAITSPTWPDVLAGFIRGEADYLFFSDGGVDIMCLSIEVSCEGIQRLFQFKLATTYLAVSKQGTSKQFVERLRAASDSFKASSQFVEMSARWLNDYKQRKMLNLHEQDGILKLWAQTTDEH